MLHACCTTLQPLCESATGHVSCTFGVVVQEPQHPIPALSKFDPPIPDLIDGMDEEEIAITVGLGLVAREAAAVEYVLHGIYVHLADVAKAYTVQAIATGGTLVKQCRKALEQSGDSAVPATRRALLARDLDLAEEGFRLRNRFLHGYWRFDHEVQSWLTLKGAHGMTRPEVVHTDSSAVWELAHRFGALYERLVHWDIIQFGELAETEDGDRGWASVKRL